LAGLGIINLRGEEGGCERAFGAFFAFGNEERLGANGSLDVDGSSGGLRRGRFERRGWSGRRRRGGRCLELGREIKLERGFPSLRSVTARAASTAMHSAAQSNSIGIDGNGLLDDAGGFSASSLTTSIWQPEPIAHFQLRREENALLLQLHSRCDEDERTWKALGLRFG